MEHLRTRDDWKGRLIGRYQLERPLGQGALSEVWLATDTQLRRQVAMKILPTSLNDPAYLRDFIYEARAAASLEHPHILGIHDFGEQEIEPGEVMPYLVMPYVSDGTLASRLQEATGPLAIQESLRYLRQAAQAIDYAHSKRVLHRDIKPANMLLRDDWLLLSDFGLARVLGSTMMRGQTYAGAGTPEYMAPEQIMGQALPASDRYSLAIVAYQLFTGKTPFHGATPAETISQQMQAPLPPPRQFNPRIPAAVENLLIVALSRNPDLRPPTCLALVDALQKAWMTGKQTEPNPDATLLAPWSRRWQETNSSQPLPAENEQSAAIPAWSSPPPGSTPVLGLRAETPLPPPARSASTQTDVNQTRDERTPPAPDPFATNIGTGQGAASTPTSPAIPYTPSGLEKRVGRRSILIGGTAAAALVVVGGAVALTEIHAHTGASPQVGPSPTPPGPRKLVSGTPVLQLTSHTDPVWTAAWHPTGRYLLTAAKDGMMIWDIASALQKSISGSVLTTPQSKLNVAGIKFENLTESLCWSKDGRKIIVSGDLGDKIFVLDAFTANNTPTVYRDLDLSILDDNAIYVNVTPGPQTDMFTVVNSRISGSQAQVWRLGHTDLPLVNYDVADDLDVLQWSPDGNRLAAITGGLSNQNGFYVWQRSDPLHPRLFNTPQRNKATAFMVIADTLAWSPVDPHLLLVSDADEALIWDVRKDQPALILSAPVDPSIPEISKLSWSPNGRYVVGSYDAPGDNARIAVHPQIFVWDIQTLLKHPSGSDPQPPSLSFSAPMGGPQHSQSIIDLNWSPDGRYLATSSFDKSVIIWKVDGA